MGRARSVPLREGFTVIQICSGFTLDLFGQLERNFHETVCKQMQID